MAQSKDAYAMKPPPPRFAMITPSASPPVSRSPLKKPQPPPAKRPRLSSTPASSSASLSRLTPVPATAIIEQSLHDARRASSQRVMSIWESLAERYAKALDEDDIVDLRSGKVIKDRGVMRSKAKVPIGYFAGDDPDVVASKEAGHEAETEEDTDADPLDAFGADDDLQLEKDIFKVPPVRVTDPADAEDLEKFLEAEQRRRETCGADDEDDVEDEHHVLDVLGSDDWLTTDGEDLFGDNDGTSDTSEAEDALDAGVRRVQAERALTVAEGSDSEDELATWSNEEIPPIRATPARTSPSKDDIIDLTTPSPPSSPVKLKPIKSTAYIKRSPSPGPSRIKSKTPADRRIEPITPPDSPLVPLQLKTSPRSNPQSHLPQASDEVDPSSSRVPSPAVSRPPPRPKPTPRPRSKPTLNVQAGPPDSGVRSASTLKSQTPASTRTTTSSKTVPSKLMVEVVLPQRATSRPRSVAPKDVLTIPLTPTLDERFNSPLTPRKDKGKSKEVYSPARTAAVPTAQEPVDDSPSPPRPQRWKPKFQRTGVSLPSSSTSVIGGSKRKREPSSSSSSSSSRSPTGSSSPSPPLADRLRAKVPPLNTPTRMPSKTRAKLQSTVKSDRTTNSQKASARKTEHERSSHSRQTQTKQRAASRPRACEPSGSAESIPMYPYSMPYTPHRGDIQEHSGPHSQYPPIPPLLPIHDPQAQYYFAQAVHHLSYLMSGTLPPPPPGYVPPPFPLPYHHQTQTPKHHRQRNKSPSSSSPGAETSSTRSRMSIPAPFSTPHHPHPYPFTFDPSFSSGTLPPSSPIPSSPSPPPTVERRSALVRGRSRSRGRRVSFKLDDNERPRIQREGDEELDLDADTSMHTIHMSSPEPLSLIRGRSQGRAREPSSSPTKAKPKLKRITVAEEPDQAASDQKSRIERGRTPGPPIS